MQPNELADQLAKIYGDRLVSVVLYGSAANGDFHKGHSDFNIIIVLKAVSSAEVSKSSPVVKKWIKQGNPAPLFFTKEIIDSSIDVFPIEFFDIKERHKVILGADLFSNIKINPKNLRHQCEHELRSKLLALIQKFNLIADSPKAVIKLIIDSSSSFFSIFGGVLRLAGTRPASAKRELSGQIAKFAGFEPALLNEIIRVREGALVWNRNEAQQKFEQYLTSIETVVNYVEVFKH